MAYFSQKLQELLDRNEMSQTDLAKATNLSQAHISRLLSDDQRSVSLDDLRAIATNISTLDRERAELIRAHLLDECVGPGSELIDIIINGSRRQASVLNDAPAPPLSPRMERVFQILREQSEDKHLRVVLEGLVDLLDPSSSPGVPKAEAEIVAAVREEVSYRKTKKKK